MGEAPGETTPTSGVPSPRPGHRQTGGGSPRKNGTGP